MKYQTKSRKDKKTMNRNLIENHTNLLSTIQKKYPEIEIATGVAKYRLHNASSGRFCYHP